MSLAVLTSPAAVQAAISEFKRVGRNRYFENHGFGGGEVESGGAKSVHGSGGIVPIQTL